MQRVLLFGPTVLLQINPPTPQNIVLKIDRTLTLGLNVGVEIAVQNLRGKTTDQSKEYQELIRISEIVFLL